MIRILASVYEDRSKVGTLSVIDNSRTVLECPVVAKADSSLKVMDPPTGTYRFVRTVSTDSTDQDALEAYGTSVLIFEASGGPALIEALRRSGNKLLLGLHGGDLDENGKFFPTEGSLRISNDDLATVTQCLENHTGSRIILEVREEKLNFFRSWRTSNVSDDPAPLISRRSYRQQSGISRPYRSSDYSETSSSQKSFLSDPFLYLWLESELSGGGHSHSSFDGPSEPAPFVAGGGDFGGGGAGASFDDDIAAPLSETGHQPQIDPADQPLPLIVDPFTSSVSTATVNAAPETQPSVPDESGIEPDVSSLPSESDVTSDISDSDASGGPAY